MERGPDRGYSLDPDKSLFIFDLQDLEEVAERGFLEKGLDLNFVGGSCYMGANLGPQKELEAWVKPKVDSWAHGIKFLSKISK